jgi:MarR family 2-MHQ and catechol resistance regulon transcriptional repressor
MRPLWYLCAGQNANAPAFPPAASYNQEMGERYLKSVRLLAECLQSFERFSGESVRRSGLTHAQFDIIATLGNTEGMTYKELGEKTLITKGTLTGVIERLESKGLVLRTRCLDDKRSFYVALTDEGHAMFSAVFPVVVEQGRQLFDSYTDADFDAMDQMLGKLKQLIADRSTSLTTQQLKEEF